MVHNRFLYHTQRCALVICCIVWNHTSGNCLDTRQLHLVTCAAESIGEKEIKPNRSPYIDACNKLAGAALGSPWCASVNVMWHTQANIACPISAYCPDWFREEWCYFIKGKKNTSQTMPGDVIGIWFADKGRIAHMELVESYDEKWTNTIGGNTSDTTVPAQDRDGDVVMRKKRLNKLIHSRARYWDKQYKSKKKK